MRIRSSISFLHAAFPTAAALALLACGSGAEAPTETQRASEEPIINGDAVSTSTMNSLGLVNINFGFCSGVLLNSRWVLTAQHCVQGPGSLEPGPTSVSVQLASGGATYTSANVYLFGEHDIALVQLSQAVSINGSTSFSNSITPYAPASLYGDTLQCYGQGDNSFPQNGAGTWRTASIKVTSWADDSYTLTPNASGQIQWKGDSGGPCFYGGKLTGIQSGASYNCSSVPAGATCGPQYASSINSASQASLQYVSGWINLIMNPPILGNSVHGGISVIQSTYGSRGNFELIAPVMGFNAHGMVHYFRNNDGAGNPWQFLSTFGTDLPSVTGAVVIESSYGNLDLVAVSGSSLYSLWKAPTGGWSSSYAIPGANHERGTPGFWQGTYGTPGNFEVAVPNVNGGIDYFWRNNGATGLPWENAGTFATSLGKVDDVVMFESKQGTMELVARVGMAVYHMTRGTNFAWTSPLLVAGNAAGRPSFFQSDWGTTGNYELIVPSTAGGFDEYWRNNDAGDPTRAWSTATPVFRGVSETYDSAAAFQSNYTSNGHRNFELFGNVGSAIGYGFRDSVSFPTTFGGTGFDLRYVGPFNVGL